MTHNIFSFRHHALGSLALTVVLSAAPAMAEQVDVIIRHGLVMDGSGKPAFPADVAIRAGKIVAMGDVSAYSASQTLDASGLVVSPGFIDLHSHAERSIEQLPELKNLVQQGITTILGGNCGFSPVEIGDFFQRIEPLPLGPNIGLLVGHNDIRQAVMGTAQRAATEDELRAMRQRVNQAMVDGAFGFSTGLKYVPGVYSDYQEVKQLSAVAQGNQGFFASHMRDEGAHIDEAMEEVINLARDTGIAVHISHHKLVGQPNWGHSDQTLATIDKARHQGLDVTLDQYPYTASSTRFSILFPPWSLADGQEEVYKRLADPQQRAKIKAGIITNIRDDRGGGDPARLQIAHFDAHPEWDGKTFADVLTLQGRELSIENAAELAMEIQAKGGAQGIFHAIDEADVKAIMQYPFTSIASDTGGVAMGEGSPHPRSYGTFPRVLGEYARHQGLLSLPEAVRRMTSLPAERMGLDDRGLLKTGYQADIVVFDANTVADKATFTQPHQYATGIEYILVNGVLVKTPEGFTGEHGGQILRHHPVRT